MNVVGEKMEIRELTELQKQVITEKAEWREMVPKRFAIRMQDIERYKPTKGCKGCATQLSGKARRPHVESCMLRFEKLLEDDDRIKESKKRADELYEFYEKVLEKTDGDCNRKVRADMDDDIEDDPQKRLRRDDSTTWRTCALESKEVEVRM